MTTATATPELIGRTVAIDAWYDFHTLSAAFWRSGVPHGTVIAVDPVTRRLTVRAESDGLTYTLPPSDVTLLS